MAQRHASVNSLLNAREQEFKQLQMNKYKQDLDIQLATKNQLKAYGNMSNVEKNLNRADLNAYKSFDNN